MVAIKFHPKEALVDDLVYITIDGLFPEQRITVYASMYEDCGDVFESYAYYKADPDGAVDISEQKSVGGSYTGVEPMGLFWSMKPSPKNKRSHSRFVMRDVTSPLKVLVKVYSSHLFYDEIEKEEVLGHAVIERWYKHKNVQRIPVRDGRLRGTLFVPEGKGPHPAVVDLFGTAGGLMEFRASLLASRGFLTLSLAFFDYDDLPETAFDFELEYLEEAKDFLLRQPTSLKHGVGIVGVSVGGTLALAGGTYVDGFICTVAINGPIFAQYTTMSYKGRIWQAKKLNINRAYVDQNTVILKHILDDHWGTDLSEANVEFHKSKKSFLFIYCEDDKAINVPETMKVTKSLLRKGNAEYKILVYPGAGHLLEPPYSPHSGATFTKLLGMPQGWGGNTKQHADAQLDSWHEILRYLKDSLTRPSKL